VTVVTKPNVMMKAREGILSVAILGKCEDCPRHVMENVLAVCNLMEISLSCNRECFDVLE
jgi:hypothetical protein